MTDALPAREYVYDAFLSYNWAVDKRLAPQLQASLESLAKPVFRRRALRIFRDTSSMNATEDIWRTVQDALDSSRYFVLLASPRAAQSAWVRREVRHWVSTRDRGSLLLAVTDGVITWGTDDFDWRHTDCLPAEELRGWFTGEPLFVDLRWTKDSTELSARNPQYQSCVADLAAPIHGVRKDDLIGEDLRLHRRMIHLRRAAVAVLSVLLVLALLATAVAVQQRRVAVAQRASATARSLILQAESSRAARPDLALRLALTAWAVAPGSEPVEEIRGLVAGSRFVSTLADDPKRLTGEIAVDQAGKIAVVKRDGLEVWDISTPERPVLKSTVRPPPGSAPDHSGIGQLVLSPDGRTAAGVVVDGQVRFWDLTDPRHPRVCDRTVLPASSARPLRFSANGRRLVAGGDGAVRIFGVGGGSGLRELGTVQIGESETFAAVSPSGMTLVTTGSEGGTTLWDVSDVSTARRIVSWPAGGRTPTAASFLSNNLLAIGGEAGALELWKITDRTPRLMSTLSGHTADIQSLAASADGRVLASGSLDSTARAWDVANPERPRVIAALRARGAPGIISVALTSGARRLVTGSGDAVMVWRLDESVGAPTAPVLTGLGGDVGGIELSRTGVLSVSPTTEPSTLWDVSRGKPRKLSTLTPATDFSSPDTVSPDGAKLVRSTETDTGRPLELWDIRKPTAPRRVATLIEDAGAIPPTVAFDASGTLLAVGDHGGAVRVWALGATVKMVYESDDEADDPASVAFDPRTGTLVRYSRSGVTELDLFRPGAPQGRTHRPAGQRPGAELAATLFTAAGRRLLTMDSSSVTVWDTTGSTWKPHGTIPDAADDIEGFDVAGTVVALTQGSEIVLWDISDPTAPNRVVALHGHTGAVQSLVFSADGTKLFSGGEDQTVWAWDLTSYLAVRGDVRAAVCARVQRGLTREEWKQYAPEIPYEDVCP